MRALVTGSHGFIGSNLVKRLKDEGHEVFEWDTKIGGDAAGILPETTAEVIFHLACVNQMEATKQFRENLRVNAGLAKYLAQVAAANNAKFIYTSTASVYGAQPDFNIPTSTLHYVNPQSDYAVAKLAGEWFVRNSGADYTILRLSNVYGPGQTTDNPYCGVVGRFFDQALKDEPLTIIGTGEQTRDFTYVADVVNWLMSMGLGGPYLNKEAYRGRVLNVSHGQETSIYELAEEIENLRGDFPGYSYIPERPIDGIKRRCLLPDLHCPTDLTTGLKATLNWLSART